MELRLSKLPKLRGIYDGKVPAWALYLEPEAAESLRGIETATGGLIYTSVWRSANGSLWAIKNKSGAMPPGFSAHNYGLAVDLTVKQILKEGLFVCYEQLYTFMEDRGWYCHRRDMKEKFEYWHFNFLGESGTIGLASTRSKTWHLPIEARIAELYADDWELDDAEVQTALKKLKFYHERVDGLWGPYSRSALNAFQRAYKMRQTRDPTDRDKRTLAFCTAKKVIV